jgi:hypothetical protein
VPIAAIVEGPPLEGQDPREMYDQLTREISNGEPMTRTSQWSDGLIAHIYCVGEDGGSIAIDVWQDEASWNSWLEKLAPVAERMGASPQTQIRVLQVHNIVLDR